MSLYYYGSYYYGSYYYNNYNYASQVVKTLNDGEDTVTVGSIACNSKITTGNDDDKVIVQGHVSGNTIIDTSGIVVEEVAGTPDTEEIVYDPVTDEYITIIIPGTPAVEGRTDDDLVSICGSTYDCTTIKTGAGDDVIKVGDSVKEYSKIYAGEGDDIVSVVNQIGCKAKIDGGEGFDTLYIGEGTSKCGSVSQYADAYGSSLSGFEKIVLGGNSTIDLTIADVMRNNDDGDLFINGTSSNLVDLGGYNSNNNHYYQSYMANDRMGGCWEKTGSETVDGVEYKIFQNSIADDLQVYIEHGVAVI